MADTTYVDYVAPAVNAEWLNEVNDHVWHDTPVSGTTVHGSDVIEFTPTGTGATATTAQARFRQLPVTAQDFNATADGVANDSTPLTNAKTTGKKVFLPKATYACADVQLSTVSLQGEGAGVTVLKANSTTEVLRLGWTTPNWTYRSLSDLTINGNSKASDGVSFEDTSTTYISGRWVFNNVSFTGCVKGVNKPSGNIGNAFYNCNFVSNDYGYYADDNASMHAGADLFFGGEISGNVLAGIYIDSVKAGTGGTQLRGTIIENNAGFGVFVKNWITGYTPLVLDGVWFESNASSGSVTINGTPYTPHDIYLENTRHCVLQNGIVPDIQLVNSNLTIENSFMNAGNSAYSLDATSTCIADNVNIDGGAHPIEVHRVATCYRPLGGQAARFRGRPRSRTVESALGTVLQSITYATADTYSFPGTTTVNATTTADGVIFDSCAELIIPAGNTQVQASVSITSGKWYLLSYDIRFMSGTLADLAVTYVNSGTAFNDMRTVMKSSGWTTIVGMGEAESSFTGRLTLVNRGASPMTLRLSALQLMEFDTERDMLEYYNSGAYSTGTAIPSEVYSTIAPTTGTWEVGDRQVNRTPTIANPVTKRIVTTAGTPGTWTATSWIVSKGTTANRPTLAASDGGVQYLDTTLDADGKPIWWTGTAWVDATGAVV